jgi:hypothetical protein
VTALKSVNRPSVARHGVLYYTTGNGDFNGDSGGPDFGDSVLRLSLSGASFTLDDYFTPWNQATLDSTDKDQGSGSILRLGEIRRVPLRRLAWSVNKQRQSPTERYRAECL